MGVGPNDEWLPCGMMRGAPTSGPGGYLSSCWPVSHRRVNLGVVVIETRGDLRGWPAGWEDGSLHFTSRFLSSPSLCSLASPREEHRWSSISREQMTTFYQGSERYLFGHGGSLHNLAPVDSSAPSPSSHP